MDEWVSDKQGSCGRSQELNGGAGKRWRWARNIACEQGRFLGPSPEPLNQNLHLDKVLGEACARTNGTLLVLNPTGPAAPLPYSSGPLLHSEDHKPPRESKGETLPRWV